MFPTSIVQNILLVLVLVLSLGWGISHAVLKSKYNKNKLEFSQYKQQVVEAELKAIEDSRKLENNLRTEYEKELDRLKNEKAIINNMYNTNVSLTNSLRETLGNKQKEYDQLSRSQASQYTSTVSKLLGECSEMVTEVSARADEAVAEAVSKHNTLVKQKEIVDKFNKDSLQ